MKVSMLKALLLPLLLTATVSAADLPKAERDISPATNALKSALDGPADLPPLRKAAESAAATLGPDWQASDRLKQAAQHPDAAKLKSAVQSVYEELMFQPVTEGAPPAGFPPYTPVGEVEVKRYPAYRMARAATATASPDVLFFRLFGHIKSANIEMTAPVETTYAATRPAGEGKDAKVEGGSTMAFLYPESTTGKPGIADGVDVVDVPAQTVVSLGRRGRSSRADVTSGEKTLKAWLADHPAYQADGRPRAMSYNSPIVPPPRSYYEVQLPVKRSADAAK